MVRSHVEVMSDLVVGDVCSHAEGGPEQVQDQGVVLPEEGSDIWCVVKGEAFEGTPLSKGFSRLRGLILMAVKQPMGVMEVGVACNHSF